MSIKDICQKLNISNSTLKNWIDRFEPFFSEGAGAHKRQFEVNDLDTLATIATLSQQGMNYDAIEQRLHDGYREDFEGVTLGVDSRVIPASTAYATIDAAEIRSRLEAVEKERDRLLADNAAKDKRIDALTDEIKQLNREIGRLEGRLEHLKNE